MSTDKQFTVVCHEEPSVNQQSAPKSLQTEVYQWSSIFPLLPQEREQCQGVMPSVNLSSFRARYNPKVPCWDIASQDTGQSLTLSLQSYYPSFCTEGHTRIYLLMIDMVHCSVISFNMLHPTHLRIAIGHLLNETTRWSPSTSYH